MYQFAQNYPQLMNQAAASALSQADLLRLRQAFDFSQLVANGFYRAQGIPLLNHLVRTASIVLSQTSSIDAVITALLHASFVIDQFEGSTKSHNQEVKQKDIEKVFGSKASHLLLAYGKMGWYGKKEVRHYIDTHLTLTDEVRVLLLIRLANELEDHMDFAMAYTQPSRIARRSLAYGTDCVDLARVLGFDSIANMLETILIEQKAIEVSAQLRSIYGQGYAVSEDIWAMNVFQRTRRKLALLARKHLGRH
jgi:(p)ppGpp synthase/HD superfamily hydrolase